MVTKREQFWARVVFGVALAFGILTAMLVRLG